MDRKNDIYRTLAGFDGIYVYGDGESSIKTMDFLQSINLKTKAHIVSTRKILRVTKSNQDVLAFDEIDPTDKRDVIVIGESLYHDEMLDEVIGHKTANIVDIQGGGGEEIITR